MKRVDGVINLGIGMPLVSVAHVEVVEAGMWRDGMRVAVVPADELDALIAERDALRAVAERLDTAAGKAERERDAQSYHERMLYCDGQAHAWHTAATMLREVPKATNGEV